MTKFVPIMFQTISRWLLTSAAQPGAPRIAAPLGLLARGRLAKCSQLARGHRAGKGGNAPYSDSNLDFGPQAGRRLQRVSSRRTSDTSDWIWLSLHCIR